MGARREVVDEHGYLHTVSEVVPGQGERPVMLRCTCGHAFTDEAYDAHLEELGHAIDAPPPLPTIDAETRTRAINAGRLAAARHNTAGEDLQGFVVCQCGVPFPTWDVWGDHYADVVLATALNEISIT